MALADRLKRLAQLPRTDSPFLSLYLGTRWDNEKQRERVRIFAKTQLKDCLSENGHRDAAARESLEQDAERINRYVKGVVNREWDEVYSGIAVFSCAAQDVYEVVRSHMPFTEDFSCTDRPVLRQAARHAHVGEPALVAVVAGDAGRLLEVELGGVKREISFEDREFPGRHEQGGWSQARYQRHVDEHIHRNLKLLAGHLVRWTDEGNAKRVVLAGREALVASFDDHLPKRVSRLICCRIPGDPKGSADELLAEASRALAEAQARGDREQLDTVLDKGLGMGKAVAGLDPVCDAVAAGKVHQLYVEQDFHTVGWTCFGCGALGLKMPLGCPRCGAEAEAAELGEEFIRGVLAADGEALVVESHGGLERNGGVAAVLRYA